MEIRNNFYRVSIKALVLSEERDKFLIVKESDGRWELPGGGLDWGVTPQEDLRRELREEMGLEATWIADNPSYFITGQNHDKTIWVANVLYETELESFDFTPSDECTEILFVDKHDIKDMKVFPTITQLAEMFDSTTFSRKL